MSEAAIYKTGTECTPEQHKKRVKALAESMKKTKQSIINSNTDKVGSMLMSHDAKVRLINNPILNDIKQQVDATHER